MLDDVAIGVAAELASSRIRLPFGLAVLFEDVAGPVVAVAVELDGELVVRPTTVDRAASGRAVGPWEREVVRLQGA
jgi:hypothetical protein